MSPQQDLLANVISRLDDLYSGKIPAPIDESMYTESTHRHIARRLNQLIEFFEDLSNVIIPLIQGGYISAPPRRDHFLAPALKTFHSQLLHLTRQAKQVADGDYSQRLAFLGEFADAFNALIISLEQKEQILISLVRTDGLTGIHNRKSLNDLLAAELYRARRYKTPLTVVLFDIDYFKQINDTYGHQIGDEVLKTMAALVQSHIRPSDIFGRWGGEEFLIVAPGVDSEQGKRFADKIRRLIEHHGFGQVRQVTASFGVTAFCPDDSCDSLLLRADQALYEAKHAGRNRVVAA